MRPLVLHVSALNDDEYTFYTTSLTDLALQPDAESNENRDDAYFNALSVGIRETRAWLRGRFSNVPGPSIDSILKLFHPNLNQIDTLSGGQFFAAIRLVLHVQSGKPLDRALAFVQAHPRDPSPPPSRPVSPTKWGNQPQPPPLHPDTPIRRLTQTHAHAPITSLSEIRSTNPFSPPFPSTPQRAGPAASNPFVGQRYTRDHSAPELPHVPPLPPRKPPPPIPNTPPRHAISHSANLAPTIKTSLSAPAHPSLPIPSQKPGHSTSSLMRQSLQASKAAQMMKKAEEELEQERVLSVLKRSRAGSNPTSINYNDGTAFEASLPPLPRRRSPSSSTNSISSMEHVESTSQDRPWDLKEKIALPLPGVSPWVGSVPSTSKPHFSSRPLPIPNQSSRFISPERSTKTTDSPLPSPPHHRSIQLHTVPQVFPPPTHPDRKPFTSYSSSTDSFDLVYPDPEEPRRSESMTTTENSSSHNDATTTPQQASSRMSRSKSLHHPSPPMPPPRRKRPESAQLTPTSVGHLPDDDDDDKRDVLADDSPFDPSPSPSRRHRLSRTLSLSLDHDKDTSSFPLNNIQRTIAKLDALQPRLASGLESLQPKLDRARYKAEAGLSWRGYLNHHGLTGKRGPEEEGEKGLIRNETGNGSEARSGRSSVSELEKDRPTRDDLKWPAGEGWHPL